MEEAEYVEVPIGSCVIINGKGAIACRGLGSCLAIVLYNRVSRIGGLAHAMLPTKIVGTFDVKLKKENEAKNCHYASLPLHCAKYADEAIDLMLEKIGHGNIKAKLVGGASMFGTDDIGKRNIEKTKKELAQKGIKIVGEDVGGNRARSCFFNVETQEVKIRVSVRVGFSVKFVEKII